MWGLKLGVELVILPAEYAGIPITFIISSVVAVLYFIALIGVLLGRTWGPLVAGTTALVDLVLGFFLSAKMIYALTGAVLLPLLAILAFIELGASISHLIRCRVSRIFTDDAKRLPAYSHARKSPAHL